MTLQSDGAATHGVTPKELSAFKWDILWSLLGAGEVHGLGLKASMGDYRGEDVNHGRLYPNLDQLVDAGLVEKTALDQRTNGYSLTDQGRDVLEARYQFLHDQIHRHHFVDHDSGTVSLVPQEEA